MAWCVVNNSMVESVPRKDRLSAGDGMHSVNILPDIHWTFLYIPFFKLFMYMDLFTSCYVL